MPESRQSSVPDHKTKLARLEWEYFLLELEVRCAKELTARLRKLAEDASLPVDTLRDLHHDILMAQRRAEAFQFFKQRLWGRIYHYRTLCGEGVEQLVATAPPR